MPDQPPAGTGPVDLGFRYHPSGFYGRLHFTDHDQAERFRRVVEADDLHAHHTVDRFWQAGPCTCLSPSAQTVAARPGHST